MRRRLPAEARTESQNMTPMIDVVFQLLIFFMLSMHFKEVEGKLLSQLPRDKGIAPTNIAQIQLQEVRIVICAGGDTAAHLKDKAGHDKTPKDPKVCRVLVDRIEIGDVYLTEREPGRTPANRAVYARLGNRTRELYQAIPFSKDAKRKPPVILDADSEVPYEHIIGAVNACKIQGIDNVEFVANPKHEKYFEKKP